MEVKDVTAIQPFGVLVDVSNVFKANNASAVVQEILRSGISESVVEA